MGGHLFVYFRHVHCVGCLLHEVGFDEAMLLSPPESPPACVCSWRNYHIFIFSTAVYQCLSTSTRNRPPVFGPVPCIGGGGVPLYRRRGGVLARFDVLAVFFSVQVYSGILWVVPSLLLYLISGLHVIRTYFRFLLLPSLDM